MIFNCRRTNRNANHIYGNAGPWLAFTHLQDGNQIKTALLKYCPENQAPCSQTLLSSHWDKIFYHVGLLSYNISKKSLGLFPCFALFFEKIEDPSLLAISFFVNAVPKLAFFFFNSSSTFSSVLMIGWRLDVCAAVLRESHQLKKR